MPPVLCVVGRSGCQAVIEGIVCELTATGVRVATVVETAATLPMPSEATARYMSAGSEMTIVKAPGAIASVRKSEDDPSLDELVWEMRDDYDLVIADGFERSSFLKLEVHRAEEGDLICHKNELLAIVGDKPEGVDLTAFAPDDFARIADLVRRRFLTQERGEDATLFIDGVRLPLALFVRKLVASTILGMVHTLKGVDDPKSVVVAVRRRG
jgi:molybdopterin-guanine dinucleotide biosynthesis protein MobB